MTQEIDVNTGYIPHRYQAEIHRGLKMCRGCCNDLPLEGFPKNKASPDGRYRLCRSCNAAALRKRNDSVEYKSSRATYLAANRETVNRQASEWYWRNVETGRRISRDVQRRRRDAGVVQEYMKTWRATNRERVAQAFREWAKANPHRVVAQQAKRRAALMNALPRWADLAAIEAVYAKRKARSDADGISYHVDHIVPLVSSRVCGLHVPWNLQLLPGPENQAKGNRLAGD